jgi:hypothetical protein
MTLTRDLILSELRARLEADERVLALWLEGADATGMVDEYSDIDLCCSTAPGALEAVTRLAQETLAKLGKLDLMNQSMREDNAWFTIYHLEGTSPYLLIDFDAFVGRGSQFYAGDTIERPKILFDRAGVITFIQPAEGTFLPNPEERLRELSESVQQSARIEKYIRRGEFLEAFGYYHKWLLQPLIEALRMRYTPLHPDYYIVHISRHLPGDVRKTLEALFQVSSLEELERKSALALTLFAETVTYIKTNHPV